MSGGLNQILLVSMKTYQRSINRNLLFFLKKKRKKEHIVFLLLNWRKPTLSSLQPISLRQKRFAVLTVLPWVEQSIAKELAALVLIVFWLLIFCEIKGAWCAKCLSLAITVCSPLCDIVSLFVFVLDYFAKTKSVMLFGRKLLQISLSGTDICRMKQVNTRSEHIRFRLVH